MLIHLCAEFLTCRGTSVFGWVLLLFVSCTIPNTSLPILSHYSTDQQVAVMCQHIVQCTGREEDCKLGHTDVNNTRFTIPNKSSQRMFFSEKKCFPRICYFSRTHTMGLVRDTECKWKFCSLYKYKFSTCTYEHDFVISELLWKTFCILCLEIKATTGTFILC